MKIDEIYSRSIGSVKEQFYVGIVSKISRNQVVIHAENLTTLNYRKDRGESIIPSTINNYVIIDSINGIFIGKVVSIDLNDKSRVDHVLDGNFNDSVYPALVVQILGVLSENGEPEFVLPGSRSVGVTDKTYIANSDFIQIYVDSLEKEHNSNGNKLGALGYIDDFENTEVNLNPNTLFSNHLITIGATNSGKSTTALTILDRLIEAGKKVIILDPTGEYEDTFKDDENVTKLVIRYVENQDKVEGKEICVIPTSMVSMEQWEQLFQVNDGSQYAILRSAIFALKTKPSGGVLKKVGEDPKDIEKILRQVEADKQEEKIDFNIAFLKEQILADAVRVNKDSGGKYAVDYARLNTNEYFVERINALARKSTFKDIFATPDEIKEQQSGDKSPDISILKNVLDEFLANENSIYIDTSGIGLSPELATFIVDVINSYLISNVDAKTVPFVLFIDEAHRYTTIENSFWQSGLTSIAREGRKKGIFLFLTTQSPKDIPDVILGQIGTMIIHRLRHSDELSKIGNWIESGDSQDIISLDQGEAILTSVNMWHDIQVHFKKSNRDHNNDTPRL